MLCVSIDGAAVDGGHFILVHAPSCCMRLYCCVCLCLCCSTLVTAAGSQLPFHAVELVEDAVAMDKAAEQLCLAPRMRAHIEAELRSGLLAMHQAGIAHGDVGAREDGAWRGGVRGRGAYTWVGNWQLDSTLHGGHTWALFHNIRNPHITQLHFTFARA